MIEYVKKLHMISQILIATQWMTICLKYQAFQVPVQILRPTHCIWTPKVLKACAENNRVDCSFELRLQCCQYWLFTKFLVFSGLKDCIIFFQIWLMLVYWHGGKALFFCDPKTNLSSWSKLSIFFVGLSQRVAMGYYKSLWKKEESRIGLLTGRGAMGRPFRLVDWAMSADFGFDRLEEQGDDCCQKLGADKGKSEIGIWILQEVLSFSNWFTWRQYTTYQVCLVWN